MFEDFLELGNLGCGVMQQLLDNDLARNSLSSSISLSGYQSMLQQPGPLYSAYLSQLYASISAPTERDHRPYWRSKAERLPDEGGDLIARIAFWSPFRPLSNGIVRRMAGKLDAVCDELETCANNLAEGVGG